MKASWVLLLAGLFWGALAAEVSTEAACAADGCAKRGGALLQKAPALNAASEPVSEDDATADDGDEDEAEDEAEEEEEALVDAGQKPCDKWKKSKVQKKVSNFEEKLKKLANKTAMCEQRVTSKLAILRKEVEHYKKCAGKYSDAFVADGASEDIPDAAEDTETADLSESVEDAEEAMEVEELEESVMEADDLDELADDEVQDELDEAKELMSRSRGVKPCDKVKEPLKHVAKKEAKVKKLEPKLAECTTKRAARLDKFTKRLEHFKKCL